MNYKYRHGNNNLVEIKVYVVDVEIIYFSRYKLLYLNIRHINNTCINEIYIMQDIKIILKFG